MEIDKNFESQLATQLYVALAGTDEIQGGSSVEFAANLIRSHLALYLETMKALNLRLPDPR